jgi:nitronate monooxygenase
MVRPSGYTVSNKIHEDRFMTIGERFTKIFGVQLPIIQAPMAGSSDAELAIAVAEAGGLGSLPCAMLTPEDVRASLLKIRERTQRPINLNFFCHRTPAIDEPREKEWRETIVSLLFRVRPIEVFRCTYPESFAIR